MSQLAESLKAIQTPVKLCAVGKVLAKVKGEDRQALIDVLASDVSKVRLSLVLRQAGFNVGATVIGYHRSGTCCCEPVG